VSRAPFILHPSSFILDPAPPPAARLASAAGSTVLWSAAAFAAGAGAAAAAGLAPAALPLVAGAALGTTIFFGASIPSIGVFGRPILGARTARREVSLTFDDGPDPVQTLRVLNALDAAGQRGTFFVVGERAQRHPEILAEIARRGHEVANHSWRHSLLTTFVPPRRLASELDRTSEAVAEATGTRPRWFRPPVGLMSPRVAEAARMAGLRTVLWSAAARDGIALTTPDQALARLARGLRPGAILVLHDSASGRDPVAPQVLARLLPMLDAAGLRSVTLDELLRAPA